MTVQLDYRTVTARKAHQCLLCRQDIQPRERYNRQSIVWEGSIETVRAHLYCQAVLNLHYEYWCHSEGYGPDDFDEDMSEAWGEAERSAANGLTYPWLVNGWDA